MSKLFFVHVTNPQFQPNPIQIEMQTNELVRDLIIKLNEMINIPSNSPSLLFLNSNFLSSCKSELLGITGEKAFHFFYQEENIDFTEEVLFSSQPTLLPPLNDQDILVFHPRLFEYTTIFILPNSLNNFEIQFKQLAEVNKNKYHKIEKENPEVFNRIVVELRNLFQIYPFLNTILSFYNHKESFEHNQNIVKEFENSQKLLSSNSSIEEQLKKNPFFLNAAWKVLKLQDEKNIKEIFQFGQSLRVRQNILFSYHIYFENHKNVQAGCDFFQFIEERNEPQKPMNFVLDIH
jgi:hypothetical protein